MTADDALFEIARQMRVSNALELVRISYDHAWNADLTSTVGDTLHIALGDIYPPRCPAELRDCQCILTIGHPGRHGAIERETLIVWPT
jgi:hypothetical protein